MYPLKTISTRTIDDALLCNVTTWNHITVTSTYPP